jgi:chromosomal replication initiator protein
LLPVFEVILVGMHDTLWNTILSDVCATIDSNFFETWLKPVSVPKQYNSSLLVLEAPNQFFCDFLEQNYKKVLLSTAKKYSPDISDISFIPSESVPSERNPDHVSRAPSSPLSPVLNKRFTFSSFVVGAGNQFAKSAACAVSEAPGKTKFNPLLIYSGVGLGKTHLLLAIGNYVLSSSPASQVVYISSEEFYLGFIDAIKNNSTKKYTEKFRSSDVLLMDDVQFFAGKESTQEEFFYIFNTLYQNGKQIVITSDLPPNSLKGLHDRLISRFQWGLCVDIQPPNLETRVAILKKKAEEDNLDIPESVLYFIAENVSSNIRQLEGVIIRILAYASITKSDISLDLVKNILKLSNKNDAPRVSIDNIIEKVSSYFNVPVNNVREKNRKKEVSYCRMVAMYIAKSVTSCSLKTIGLHFGGRDHSTVIHAIQHIETLKNTDSRVLKDINYIISLFQQ